MPDAQCDMTVALICMKMRGNYGLAKKKWLEALKQIRELPEAAT